MDRDKYMSNEDRFWLARESKLVEAASSGGLSLGGK